MPEIDCKQVAADLTEAVASVFSSMLSLTVKADEQLASPKQLKADVSVLLGLTGSDFSGTVMLHTSEALARQITESMLGGMCESGAPGELSDEVRDAMGEISNIVVGSFKTSLSKRLGEAVRMTVPAVIAGRNHSTQTLSNGQWLGLRFKAGEQPLILEFSVHRE